jgi:hypothetical protein
VKKWCQEIVECFTEFPDRFWTAITCLLLAIGLWRDLLPEVRIAALMLALASGMAVTFTSKPNGTNC